MNNQLTLIIDDEPDIRELLEMTFMRMDIATRSAKNIAEAKALLKQHPFKLCLTDMKLPDGDGLDLVDYIQTAYPDLPVAVITAHGSIDTAICAMKKGAFDFISKPVDLPVLRQLIENALNISNSPRRERRTRHRLLGDSEAMKQIRSKITKVARSQAPVYISGESGSGKEMVARLIHEQSPRSDQAFIAINCGAIPHELMESEFFGHKKGSFTGAALDKEGLFKAAENGTLFLDEVGDLPFSLQVKLLRAIQEKKIRPVGGHHEISTNVRLLCATHQDLAKMVVEGKFRQDLYYRINVIELKVPPLRGRTHDIVLLIDHILSRLAKQNNISKPRLSERAVMLLGQYDFPGNVRELENILERAMALFDGEVIDTDDLNLPAIEKQEIEHSESVSYHSEQGSLDNYLLEIEKHAINEALEANKWNKTAAARQLGLSFRSFRYRLKKLNME
jgi:two-component system response regulator PilR (NtrC family)